MRYYEDYDHEMRQTFEEKGYVTIEIPAGWLILYERGEPQRWYDLPEARFNSFGDPV